VRKLYIRIMQLLDRRHVATPDCWSKPARTDYRRRSQ
jgi:hypothetical protein